jgi:diadenosine tetraphosphate (Ap4A) HIT family hydrolase
MSQKFTPKNLRKPISCYEESSWHANGLPLWENDIYSVWADLFPVTPGHLLWIPKKNTVEHVRVAYGDAYEYGLNKIESKEWAGFNIGQNIGLAAGQTVLWPHIHLIPRHEDGSVDKGGIRRAIPNGDNKQYY